LPVRNVTVPQSIHKKLIWQIIFIQQLQQRIDRFLSVKKLQCSNSFLPVIFYFYLLALFPIWGDDAGKAGKLLFARKEAERRLRYSFPLVPP